MHKFQSEILFNVKSSIVPHALALHSIRTPIVNVSPSSSVPCRTRRSQPLHLHPPFHRHSCPPRFRRMLLLGICPEIRIMEINADASFSFSSLLNFFLISAQSFAQTVAHIFFKSQRYAIFCQWTQFVILRNDFRKTFPKESKSILKKSLRKKAHFMLLYTKCAIYHSILLSIWLIPSVQLHTEEGFLPPPECLQSDPEASCTLPCPVPSN